MTKRKPRKSAKAKVVKSTRKKTTTRKRRSGNPFEIDNVRTLI